MIDFRGSQIHYSRFVPNSLSIQESQGNEKEFWKALKKTLPSSKTSGNITNICSDGVVLTSNYSIANAFNCFFVSIGQRFAENFPNVSLSAQADVTPEMSGPGFSLLSALSVRVA